MQRILDDSVRYIGVARIAGDAGNLFKVDNLSRRRSALEALASIAPFKKSADEILGHIVFAQVNESYQISQGQIDLLHHQSNDLARRAADLLEALNDVLPPERPDVFAFRLPISPSPATLDELTDLVDDLKLIFDAPLSTFFSESLCVEAFDTGSKWLELKIKAQAALICVSAICSSAYFLASARLWYRQQDAQTQMLELGVEQKKLLVDASHVHLEALSRKLARDVAEQYGDSKHRDFNEHVNLMNASITKLSELIEKGTQVQPSSAAPEAVRALMPKLHPPVPLLPTQFPRLPATTLAADPREAGGKSE
jgi:hypothetical protein